MAKELQQLKLHQYTMAAQDLKLQQYAIAAQAAQQRSVASSAASMNMTDDVHTASVREFTNHDARRPTELRHGKTTSATLNVKKQTIKKQAIKNIDHVWKHAVLEPRVKVARHQIGMGARLQHPTVDGTHHVRHPRMRKLTPHMTPSSPPHGIPPSHVVGPHPHTPWPPHVQPGQYCAASPCYAIIPPCCLPIENLSC